MGLWEPPSQKPAGGAAHPGHLLSCSPNWPLCVQVENEELRHLLWSSVVFYQTPGLEVTACVLLSTKAVYFVLHDGLRRYFSEPLQGGHWGSRGWEGFCLWTPVRPEEAAVWLHGAETVFLEEGRLMSALSSWIWHKGCEARHARN